MSDEDALHGIITNFMLNTCRYTINENNISYRKFVGDFANALANWLFSDTEAFSSGSLAELYIRPILYCYGDIDIMHNSKTVVAIPYGKMPRIELWNSRHTLLLCMKSSPVTSLNMFTYNSRTLFVRQKTAVTSFGA